MKKAEENQKLSVQVLENDWYITSTYPITKAHYILFVATATGDRLQVIKQYPEWNLEVSIPWNTNLVLHRTRIVLSIIVVEENKIK